MLFLEILFFVSCFLVFYNYIGYAIIPWITNKLFIRRTEAGEPFFPGISFIVAAYNEEYCIQQKIENSISQAYPDSQIEFIFITDGSTDRTYEIISNYPGIRLLHESARKGKSAALNRAVQHARNDILIFSDANTLLNKDACKKIARHYRDRSTGGVAGEKRVLATDSLSEQAVANEGLYWKYESALKKIDSDFHSVVGAAGELFSVRKELYEEVPDNVILDDFVISLRVAGKGYRIIYEPAAYAMELPSFSIQDEKKRKIRIAAGGFQAICMLYPLLFFWKHFRLSYLYISHRVLRWAVTPFCLIIAFFSNLLLTILSQHPLYITFFTLQVIFYISAFAGSKLPVRSGIGKLLGLPYYFSFMNFSVILGFFRFLKGRQPATWEKVKRSA
ncbi:MAG TPA: glycosyltransferase family 2 protein [Chitinophagaceae bacterium]|nr:glycosyltransferase family 2 protein [Chitinophagaceae bacterium]